MRVRVCACGHMRACLGCGIVSSRACTSNQGGTGRRVGSSGGRAAGAAAFTSAAGAAASSDDDDGLYVDESKSTDSVKASRSRRMKPEPVELHFTDAHVSDEPVSFAHRHRNGKKCLVKILNNRITMDLELESQSGFPVELILELDECQTIKVRYSQEYIDITIVTGGFFFPECTPLLHILTLSLHLLFIVLSLSFQIDMQSGSMHVKLTGQTEEAEKLRCYASAIKGGDKEGTVWIALINTNTFSESPKGKDLRSLRDAVSLIVCARVLVCLQHNLKGLHVRPLPFQPSGVYRHSPPSNRICNYPHVHYLCIMLLLALSQVKRVWKSKKLRNASWEESNSWMKCFEMTKNRKSRSTRNSSGGSGTYRPLAIESRPAKPAKTKKKAKPGKIETIVLDDDSQSESNSPTKPSQEESERPASQHRGTRRTRANAKRKFHNNIEMFVYPPGEKGGIKISTMDTDCLDKGEFLNDVIINFYLKKLEKELEPGLKERVHFFSTFFYKKLTQGGKRKGDIAKQYKTYLKRWTKDTDIFAKDFLIVPVNQSAHWFLFIICFPGMNEAAYLKEQIEIIVPEDIKADVVMVVESDDDAAGASVNAAAAAADDDDADDDVKCMDDDGGGGSSSGGGPAAVPAKPAASPALQKRFAEVLSDDDDDDDVDGEDADDEAMAPELAVTAAAAKAADEAAAVAAASSAGENLPDLIEEEIPDSNAPASLPQDQQGDDNDDNDDNDDVMEVEPPIECNVRTCTANVEVGDGAADGGWHEKVQSPATSSDEEDDEIQVSVVNNGSKGKGKAGAKEQKHDVGDDGDQSIQTHSKKSDRRRRKRPRAESAKGKETPNPKSKPKPKSKGRKKPNKFAPRRPCILAFDSLGAGRTTEMKILQFYLENAYEDKHKDDAAFEEKKSDFGKMKKVAVKAPQQNNHCDCGVFLLHYTETFIVQAGLGNGGNHDGSSNYSDGALTVYLEGFYMDMDEKRRQIRDTIEELHQKYTVEKSKLEAKARDEANDAAHVKEDKELHEAIEKSKADQGEGGGGAADENTEAPARLCTPVATKLGVASQPPMDLGVDQYGSESPDLQDDDTPVDDTAIDETIDHTTINVPPPPSEEQENDGPL